MEFPQTLGLKADCDAKLHRITAGLIIRRDPLLRSSDDSLSGNLQVTYLSC